VFESSSPWGSATKLGIILGAITVHIKCKKRKKYVGEKSKICDETVFLSMWL